MIAVNRIIIADTEIQVQAAKTSAEKIAAVSAGAVKLICQIQNTNGGQLLESDLKPIVDQYAGAIKPKVMLGLMNELAEKFGRESGYE